MQQPLFRARAQPWLNPFKIVLLPPVLPFPKKSSSYPKSGLNVSLEIP